VKCAHSTDEIIRPSPWLPRNTSSADVDWPTASFLQEAVLVALSSALHSTLLSNAWVLLGRFASTAYLSLVPDCLLPS